MATLVGPRTYVGDVLDCPHFDGPVLHACKYPCWKRASAKLGVMALVLSDTATPHLYLNMVDPPRPIFPSLLFRASLDWLDKQTGDVLIHCNQGHSRAPSLALLWLAHRGELPRGSYAEAREAFAFDGYTPGAGIEAYLAEHWADLIETVTTPREAAG